MLIPKAAILYLIISLSEKLPTCPSLLFSSTLYIDGLQTLLCQFQHTITLKWLPISILAQPHLTALSKILILSLLTTIIAGTIFWIRNKEKKKLNTLLHTQNLEIKKQHEVLRQQAAQLSKTNSELEKLSIVARETDNAILVMDHMGNFEWVNFGYTRMFGYTLEQLIAERSRNIISPRTDNITKQKILHCIREKVSVDYEFSTETRSGNKLWVHATLTPVLNIDGNINKLVAIDSDITKLKTAQAEIKQKKEELESANIDLRIAKEKADAGSKAKSLFLASMSHEIRTPMNGIIGMLDILTGTPLNSEQEEYVKIINTSANSLMTIINDILDFSKIESGQIDLESINFDVKDQINDVIQLYKSRAQKKGLSLIANIDGSLPRLAKGDPTRLKQILTNLVNNAIKFTEVGIIEIGAKLKQAKNNALVLEFWVEDSGIGIKKGTISQLFKSFTQADSSTTRKFGGTGLGLAICKNLTSLMNGEIDVVSEEGKGSRFWFTVELEEALTASQPVINSEKMTDSNSNPSLSILLAEDNVINQKIATINLKKLGHKVTVAQNGQEAFDLYKAGSYDIILMDVQMPIMDGYDATLAIRKFEADNNIADSVRIVAVTANAMQEDEEKCLSLGMNGYISKPFRKEDLERALTN